MDFDVTEIENFISAPVSKEHIDTKLPSYHMLEGEYHSFLLGKSEDYEDLREYQMGDNIRDIDWRATARMNEPVIRRFRQEKKHDIVFLIDSGRNMLGVTPEYERKQVLALRAAGSLMNIALQHQDAVKIAYMEGKNVLSPPPTMNSSVLNSVLNNINQSEYSTRNKASNVQGLLEYAQQAIKKRSVVVIVSDTYSALDSSSQLSLLTQKHHILWLSIEDCLVANNDSSREYADIQTLEIFPTQIRTDPKIIEALNASMEDHSHKVSQLLSSARINHATVNSNESIIPSLYRLLHESSLERV